MGMKSKGVKELKGIKTLALLSITSLARGR